MTRLLIAHVEAMPGDRVISGASEAEVLGDMIMAMAKASGDGSGPNRAKDGVGVNIGICLPWPLNEIQAFRLYRLVEYGPKRERGILAEVVTINPEGTAYAPIGGISEHRVFYSWVTLGLDNANAELRHHKVMRMISMAIEAVRQTRELFA